MTLRTHRLTRISAALAATTALVLLSGCGNDSSNDAKSEATFITGTTTDSGSAGGSESGPADDPATGGEACRSVSGPLIRAQGEPRIELPQPANWKRESSVESGMVRLALVNRTMISDGFAPNVVVTVEPSSGSFDQIVNGQLAGLEQLGVDAPDGERSTVCGFDAYTVTYEASGAQGVPVHPITSRIIVVPGDGGSAQTVVLTIQSTDAENATFRADSAKILDGVQITAS